MKFLVVEDSGTMRRVVENSLNKIGYDDVVTAEDGRDGLSKFDASIDFVITDWNMPDVSGLDLVQELRSSSEGESVPILMVTTRSVREDIVTAAKAGVDNYIVKPFNPQVLREKIDDVLDGDGG